MKTSEPKTVSVAKSTKANHPFFLKDGEEVFFGENVNIEPSFIKPSSAYSVNGTGVLQTKPASWAACLSVRQSRLTIGQPNNKYEKEVSATSPSIDIYFNAEKYGTSNTGRKHLLAHELTHVVQQGDSLQKKMIQRNCGAEGIGKPEGCNKQRVTANIKIFSHGPQPGNRTVMRGVTVLINNSLKEKLYGTRSFTPPHPPMEPAHPGCH